MSSIVRISTLYPQPGDKLWITVDRARFFVGNLFNPLSTYKGGSALYNLTHSFTSLSHSLRLLNKGFELLFYHLSTVLLSSYYYYLYIYKSRLPADHPQIKVLQNNTYMSARATT
jgi:hypothetical protein